jgi:hypothetical protein
MRARPSIPELALSAAAAVVLTVALVQAPLFTLGGVAAVVVATAVILHPPAATYIVIASTPLIVGVERDALLPILRPNEVVLLVVAAAVVSRALIRGSTRAAWRFRVTAVDATILLLALTSSLLPLFWMAVRGKAISQDDVLYALTMWKYLGVYLIVRTTITTDRQVRTALWCAFVGGAFVALVAILQSLQLFGVPHLLTHYYAPSGNDFALTNSRGTSTLASSVATGDVMAVSLGLALAWLSRGGRPRGLLIACCTLFLFGVLASGQFSGVIGLGVVLLVLLIVDKRLTARLIGLLPVGVLAALVMQPVISKRVSGLSSGHLPASWSDRLNNLRTYFWPQLFPNFNWVLGVRPEARIAARQFRTGWVWIESGYTWLLWTGGVPLFCAFIAFLVATIRAAARRAREPGVMGVVGLATLACLWALAVLMLFDPHLTLRGSADLLFVLLGLTTASVRVTSGERAGGRLGDTAGALPVAYTAGARSAGA